MNEDREISLRYIIYQGFKKWRVIVITGLCISLILGIYKTIGTIIILNNSEKVQHEKKTYEILLDNFEAKGVAIQNAIKNIEESKRRQEDYNNNSILMSIDPYNEYVGTFSIYIDTNYQIMPNTIYQDVDKTDYIINAYVNYITNGELYNQLAKTSDKITEERYLTELININTDNNMVTISVKNVDEESCRQLVDLIKKAIDEKTYEVKSILGDYTYTIINESFYSNVDLELDVYQKEKNKTITDLTSSLAKKDSQYSKWLLTKRPEFPYSRNRIVITIVKLMVVGGISGILIMFFGYAILSIFTDKIISADELKKRANVNILGEIPRQNKQHNRFIDRKIRQFFHIRSIPTNATDACRMISSKIHVMIKNEKTIALVGSLSQKDMQELLLNLEKSNPKFNLVAAGDITNQAEAIDKVKISDGIILVETVNKSTYTLIRDELEMLHMWNKELIGVIINEADL